ncbi:glycoside hydrolase [Lentinus brumalis]|uniref:chitinase n=1 Tax=Lentinus brumalis TaxID=2498619 RepID=A0A371DWQ1_9APHY|nr:glycoside hydrolase [Polyporus brumalis]
MAHANRLVVATCALSLATLAQAAFDMTRSDNVVVYWGSSGNNGPTLEEHCLTTHADTIPITFVDHVDGSFSHDSCSTQGCEHDAKTCQKQGKMLTISIGGADGKLTFSSAEQAKEFGEKIYNTFLGGDAHERPFGSVVLDGIDLDIEQGNTKYYIDMVQTILSKNDDHKYYVTGAPQCYGPPDEYLEEALRQVPFDAIYVQFYNNEPCQLDPNHDKLNFGSWKSWMEANAAKKDTKIYIGAMADRTSTDTGYVEPKVLRRFVNETRTKYPDTFGGVMFWDAGLTYTQNQQNGASIDNYIKTFLTTDSDQCDTPSSCSTDLPASLSSLSQQDSTSAATTQAGGRPHRTSSAEASNSSSWAQETTDAATITSHRSKQTHILDGDDDSGTSSVTSSWIATIASSTATGTGTTDTSSPAVSSPASTDTAAVKCKCAKPWDADTNYKSGERVMYR